MSTRPTLIALLALLLCAAVIDGRAQQLYKYRDDNGVWVYTDRQPPPDRDYQRDAVTATRERAEVLLYRRSHADQRITLVARNTFYSDVQVAYRMSAMENVGAAVPTSGLKLLEPRSDSDLLTLERENPALPMRLEYEFHYIPGRPDAEHAPGAPYRLPYALATAHPVSQAFPDRTTHGDLASLHAIDFVMPIGTGIYAARGGTVIEVASDFFEAGLNPVADGPQANIVRILHDDGTMSLYAHLNWNSIRVVPGQRIARGEYIADSGNTGFSSGPHLHFVVQRNRDGAIVSVPVEFAGAGGTPLVIATGDRPIAY
jgi:murein DD-endopeptidase MepM/ murein hydrolase activator NlpD